MRVRISEIPAQGVTALLPETDRRWQARLADLSEAHEEPRVGAEVHVERSGRRLAVRGRLHGSIVQLCSRCCEPATVDVGGEFHADFLVEQDDPAESERELTAVELDSSLLAGDELELEDVVREQVLLALPPKPLCNEGCAGLCQGCGVDLNREPCSCGAPPVDPRFAALAELRLPDDKE
jgi:uncharacterized protein